MPIQEIKLKKEYIRFNKRINGYINSKGNFVPSKEIKMKKKGIKYGRPCKAESRTVCDLRAKGLSLSQIGHEIGCDKSTVSKALKKSNYVEGNGKCATVLNP